MSYTGKIRYTGSSGVDVESLVTQLMDAEALRSNKIFKQKTMLEWKQQTLRGIGDNVKTFQNNFLSFTSSSSITNMRSLGTFSTNTSNIVAGDTNKGSISAKPSYNTTAGSREVEVLQTAQGEMRTSTSSITGAIQGNTDFDPTTISEGDYFTMTVNGSPKKISFDQADVDAIAAEPTAQKQKEALQAIVQDKLTTEFGTFEGNPKVEFNLGADGMFSIQSNASVGAEITFSGFNSTENKMTAVGASALPVDEAGVITEGKTLTFEIDGNTFDIDTTGKTRDDVVAELNTAVTGAGINGLTASADENGNIIFTSEFDSTDKAVKVTSGTVTHASETLKNGVATTLFADADMAVDVDGKLTENKTYSFDIGGNTFNISSKKDDGTFKTKEEMATDINTALADAGFGDSTASVDPSGDIIMTPGTSLHNSDLNVTSGTVTHSDTTLVGSNKAIDFGIPSYQASNKLNLGQTFEEAFGSTGTMDFTINGKDFSFDSSLTSIEDAMSQINESGAGVQMTYDKLAGTFSIESTTEGAAGTINFGGDAATFFNQFNIDTTGAATQAAGDAVVTIDGQQVVREGNTFTYDDVEYDISTAQAGDTFSIEVGSETEDVFDNIVNFVDEYNKLIDELQNATKQTRKKAGSYSYYEPLTDKEKSAMSDKEIEKYEDAAKEGILYRDEHLQKLTRKLREAMNTPVTLENGEKLYLHQLGITTGDYTTGAQLVVDKDKLKEGLEKYGADVGTLFANSGELVDGEYENQGIMELVNNAIDDAVGTKGYISEYAGFKDTVLVNNNTLSKSIEDKTSKLADLERYLYRKENYYYQMFAAMEASINESNSQMGYLMSF